MNYFYDEESGRYVVHDARIYFANFSGVETDYNAAGRRNFKLDIPEEFARELMEQNVRVSIRPPREDGDETSYSVKISIYPSSDVRLKSGKAMQKLEFDDFDRVDKEFRNGFVINGEIGIEFHVSENNRLKTPVTYLRLDTAVIPIRKSRLLEEYESEEE